MRRCKYVDANATLNSNDKAPTTKKTDQQSRRTAWDSIHDLSPYRKLAKRLLRQFDKSWTSFEYPRTLKVNWIQTQSNISKLSFKLNESNPNQKPLSWGSSNDPYINLATRFSQINAEKQSLPHLSCYELVTGGDGDPKPATGIIPMILAYTILASECVSGVRLELLHTSSEIYRHNSCHSNSHQADEPGTTDRQSVAFRGKPKKGSLSEPSHSCCSIGGAAKQELGKLGP